ncbi:hypothetical protein [Polaribacter sp. Q13]|uniref:RipA family octameric membrane protein n=1 Tax=Polaribacter sp. Q13 TaxID=2806551 RepID=UPI00193C73BB|nr:hypothetical protein [Polaribacter sp. Q13]QVY66881.1 hypothetical protein JOP69_06250 [Polaribacter sp. Q13]
MDDTKLKHQLNRAYELRDFEISHYWKRAQYFWGFLAVIYAGFFATLIAFSKENNFAIEYVLIVCTIGCIFSYAWYLVNRGSKRWQEHWENVIKKLEDSLNLSLYNIHPEVESEFFNAGNFSVSRINITVSFFVFLSWISLWLFSAIKYAKSNFTLYALAFISFVCLFLVYHLGKGKK